MISCNPSIYAELQNNLKLKNHQQQFAWKKSSNEYLKVCIWNKVTQTLKVLLVAQKSRTVSGMLILFPPGSKKWNLVRQCEEGMEMKREVKAHGLVMSTWRSLFLDKDSLHSFSLTHTHHILRNIDSRYQSINDLLNTYIHTKSQQSCLILCNPTDCGLPGSSVHGILQARILEWVTMPCYRGSSLPGDWTHVSCLLHWWVGS